ncbi:MAG: hypothetical protein PUJ13_08690 [Bacteroidales bacterium]|nr:hypothetical protein [Bacteroidales bacterium]MDD7706448.1 hypothetical protein [Bacteroidales bacterium]MDY4704924.1 hypothetical protein [Prevotella sp.]
MKYCSLPFTVTKSYADTLRRRLAALESEYPNKTFNLTLVSSEPMRQNEYTGLFASTVGLDDLFL